MRKILSFELAVALKGRSKFFQALTLALLSFAVTVIVINTLIRLGAVEQEKQAYKQKQGATFAGLLAAPAGSLLHGKK